MAGKRSRWLGGVLLLALAGGPATGDERYGLALAVGAGSQTSGLGFQLDGIWRPSGGDLALSAYLGGGTLPDSSFGWIQGVRPAAGAIVFVGRRHRFLVDLNFSRVGYEVRSNELGAFRSDWYATGVSSGYELLLDSGLFFRAGVGVGYIVSGKGSPSRVLPMGNLALGVQLF